MPAAATVGDPHRCPVHDGGAIKEGSPDVMVDFRPLARVGDAAECAGGDDEIAEGAPDVLINHLPAARVGDPTARGGRITAGSASVSIGRSPQENVLVAASKRGTPFCEECEKPKRGPSGS